MEVEIIEAEGAVFKINAGHPIVKLSGYSYLIIPASSQSTCQLE